MRSTTLSWLKRGKEIIKKKIKKSEHNAKYSKDKIKNMSLQKNKDNEKEYVNKINSLNVFN